MEQLRRADYRVEDTPLWRAQDMVRTFHYAKGGANTGVYVHGLYCRRHGMLWGVAWWLPPTRVCAESVNREDWRKVLSLTRLVMQPGVPSNACSFLLGESIRRIRRDGRFVSLVTFADDSQGHTGAIYRATNWTYEGLTSASTRWLDTEGRQMTRKAGARSRTKAEMLALGYVQTAPARKHRFTMHL